MERSLEKFFREKIGSAEQQPVAWNKDTTWQLINMSLSPERKQTRFFYAVARVFMLFILAGVQIENHTSGGNVKSNPLAATAIRPSVHLSIEKECEMIQEPGINSPQHTVPRVTSQPEAVEIPEESKESIDVWIAEEINTATEESITSNEKAPEVQSVEPIIGIILPEK